MPLDYPIGIIRCDIGNPAAPSHPSVAAYRAVVGPQGPSSSLAGWRAAHYGYLNFAGSAVSPRVFNVKPEEVLGEPEEDEDGEILSYNMDRRKMGDRAIALASESGIDTEAFAAVVVIVRQGTLRHDRKPVNPFGGGASTLSDGRHVCILPLEGSLQSISHEIGHILSYDHSWGLPSNAWGWNDPPWDVTNEYGDPFCVMSGSRFGINNYGYLGAAPPAPDWPAATFNDAGPGPALALVHQTWPAALRENRCVRRYAFQDWHEHVRPIQLYAATDQTPGRTKLVILEGEGTNPEGDPPGTFYVEYRRSVALDQGLIVDAQHLSETCPAVVIHALVTTRFCEEEGDDNADEPACRQSDGTISRRGRVRDVGLKLHFRARIPVPGPIAQDWHATGSPYVRVEEVAADLSFVMLSVGAPVANTFRSLTPLGLPTTRVERRTPRVAGRQRVKTPCEPGGREFGFEIQDVGTELVLRAEVKGYGGGGPRGDSPTLTWTIEGTSVTAPPSGSAPVTGSVAPVVSVERYVRTPQPTRGDRTILVQYEVNAEGQLVLRNRPADGNYGLNVGVDADGAATTRRSSERQVLVRGHQLVWEEAQRRAVRGCLDRLLERARDIQRESPWIIRNPPPPGPYFLDDGDRVVLGRALDAFKRFSKTDRVGAKALADLIQSGLGMNLRQLAGL
jgi:hypothetical protein